MRKKTALNQSAAVKGCATSTCAKSDPLKIIRKKIKAMIT